jgi:predicted Zn-dependent peptidase
MPRNGLPANTGFLNATTLQKFQMRNITPNRVFIGAAGVENHQEFVDLVAQKLSFMKPMDSSHVVERERAVYRGGEVRNGTHGNSTDIAVCFNGSSWVEEDMLALQLANILVGDSNVFAEAVHRAQLSRSSGVTGTHNFVDSFSGINWNFKDAGLFGVRISGQTERVIF